MKRVNCWLMFLCVFFCLHHLDRVWWVLCLISMIHSLMLLLFLQCRCLLKWSAIKKWIVDDRLLCVLRSHKSDWVQWVLCLISTPHSMTLLLCLQSCSLFMRREIKTEIIVDGCLLCVFLLFSQLRSSSVSVVFDFNDSLNDVVPVSLMLFPVS